MDDSEGGGRWVVGVEMSGPVLVNVCDYVLCYAVVFRAAVWRRGDVHKINDMHGSRPCVPTFQATSDSYSCDP